MRSGRLGQVEERRHYIDSFHAALEEGHLARVDFLDVRGLRKSKVFATVVQTALEMTPPGSGKRSTLEKIRNHLGRGRPSSLFRDATLWDHAT